MPSAKFDVDVSSFKSGIDAAKSEVKTLNQQMKMLDATIKAEGKSEQTLNQQTQTLNNRMAAQKSIAKQAEEALKAMTNDGVEPTSEAYQKMARELLAAQTGMMETQAALNNMGQSAEQAAGGVEKLEGGLNGISKKISLEQVRSGISAIDKGLENAARKAVNLGKAIWENITDVARFSDDTATQAMILNMDIEDYQAYKKVFDTVGEITVQEWQKAKQKVQKIINDPTDEQVDILEMLGIKRRYLVGDEGVGKTAAKNFEDMFWEIGETLKKKVQSGELTQDLADTYANAIFGTRFSSLNPMFDMGKNAFEQEVKDQTVASEEAIKANAELNDKLIRLQGDFESLKVEVVGGLAPALTGAADALDGLLGKVLEYLQKPEGQKALQDLGTAVSGLFDDLGKIDPDKVVEGFTKVFNTVVGSVQWIVENKDGVITAMEAILVGWGALKVTGGMLDVLKIVNGIKGLSDTSGIAAAGAAAGSSWGAAFAAAALAAAPWLLAILASNAIPDENKVFKEERVQAADTGPEEIQRLIKWVELQNEVANLENKYGTNEFDEAKYEQLWAQIDQLGTVQEGDLWGRYWDYLISNDLQAGEMPTDVLKKMLEGLEPAKVEIDPEVPEDAAAKLAEQIGTVAVGVELIPTMNGYVQGVGGAGGSGRPNVLMPKANGINFVPYDGYLALLHKGEQVVPARQVNSRNFTSNLYFENVNLNNGQDAEGLAARITAQQRREMSGYGSM